MKLYFPRLYSIAWACLVTTVSCCLLLPSVHAQVAAYTSPPMQPLKHMEEQLEANYKAFLDQLPNDNKKAYLSVYNEQWESIKAKFDKREIYKTAYAQAYLDKLTKTIIDANPVLKSRPLQVCFSRSGVPNASYIGQGVILFNMGLFKSLDNESQVAFVLCHELAHYYLQHSEQSISRYVATMNGKEVQQELRKIKATEYNKRERLENLVQHVSFDSRRHSRDHESEADSMGLVFLQHTRFSLQGALTTLDLLDKIDVDTVDMSAQLQHLFNAPAYPFKKRWIAQREGLLGGHAVLEKDTALSDSLKTHPDCKLRMRLLQPYVNADHQANRQLNGLDKMAFDSLKKSFGYETIIYAFENDNYTRSLYYTIGMLRDTPDDPFLVTHMGKVLNSCYDAQKSHTLGKLIELPSPGNGTNYNVLLQMIQNLYLEDFPGISFYYLAPFYRRLQAYDPFVKEFNRAKQTNQ
ncbi:M48 family metallopeptidase [Chitinophaga eiseniae]|uniref:M48 family metalloprotease n=1 Tax=Chitinophaga eiseniae TaxID=634771 RepID=A0A847SN58_9BACT|nr:M48 family metallopeptidase [Chitinophaga eiseniae]NLR77392.1 M48 family metalloprotease [Chitinophaga eiseniae]